MSDMTTWLPRLLPALLLLSACGSQLGDVRDGDDDESPAADAGFGPPDSGEADSAPMDPDVPARCDDSFDDVGAGHLGYEAVRALYVHEVVDGCATGPLRFCPDDPLLRRQLATLLVRGMGESESTAADDAYFDDVPAGPAAGFINRLYELGITTGCAERTFCPAEPTTRAQLATFLVRALGEQPSTAADDAYFDDIGGVHAPAINRLRELGVTDGCGPRTFCPEQDARRWHAADFVASAFELSTEVCDPEG